MKKRSSRKIQSDAEPAYKPFVDDDTVRLNPLEGLLQLFTSRPLKSRSMYFRTHVRSVGHYAHRYLLHDPPRGKTILTDKDLDEAIYAETDEGLSDAQKNALDALRCIRELTELLNEGKPIYAENGRVNLYPIAYEGDKAERVRAKQQIDALTPDQYFEGLREPLARMCGFVMELTQAAMNLGFYGLLWPSVRIGAKQKRVIDALLQAAKNRAVLDENRIVKLAIKYKQKSINGTVKKVVEHWLDSRAESDEWSDAAPSYGKCQPIISALFKSLQEMKPSKKHRS